MRLREIGGRGTFTFFLLSLNGEYVFHTSPFQIGMKILLRPTVSHIQRFATTCSVPSSTVVMVPGDGSHLPLPQYDRDRRKIGDGAATMIVLATSRVLNLFRDIVLSNRNILLRRRLVAGENERPWVGMSTLRFCAHAEVHKFATILLPRSIYH